MLIRITREVRLTLLGENVQSLKAGEMYDVAPAIGGVLVGDGWAQAVDVDGVSAAAPVDTVNDDRGADDAGM